MEVIRTDYPLTVNIEKELNDRLVNATLDSSGFMYLGNPKQSGGCSREELYLFAFALGWNNSIESQFVHKESFARTTSFSTSLITAINLAAFCKACFDDPNVLLNHKRSYNLADSYANTGFHLLDSCVAEKLDSETYANNLIAEMNSLYDQLVQD